MNAEEFLEHLTNGTMPPYARKHGHLRCDTCLADIHAPAEVGMYGTDIDIESGGPGINHHITFCEECRPDDFPVRTRGIVEVIMHARVEDEGGIPRLVEPSVLATSKSDDGLDWSPGAVWEAVTQMPFEEMAEGMSGKGSAATPGNVWGVFAAFGIDVRTLLDDDGNYDADPAVEKEARQKAMDGFMSLSS